MSAESIQRQHLDELRKERVSVSRTPSPASVASSSSGKTKRTARKSIHSSRKSSVDSFAKDDDNSLASDASTSRDSRTSEIQMNPDEFRKIILGLEKDTDNSNSSKDSLGLEVASNLGLGVFSKGTDLKVGAESLPPAKPFLFEISDAAYKSAASDKSTTKESPSEEILDKVGAVNSLAAGSETTAENGKASPPLIDFDTNIPKVKSTEKDDGVQESHLSDSKVPSDETESKDAQKEDLGDINKVWENINKDLTCMADVKEDENVDEDFDPVEELLLGQSLPQPQEEPPDWEEYEEPSDTEQPENVEAEKPAPDGECVLLSSDDDSDQQKHSPKKQDEADEKETEKEMPVTPESTVEKKDENSSQEDIEYISDGEKLLLSESSEVEDASPVKESVGLLKRALETVGDDRFSKLVEKQTEDGLKENESLEKQEPLSGDELMIIDERKSEKRTVEEDASCDLGNGEQSEVKKVKLDSSVEIVKEEDLPVEEDVPVIAIKEEEKDDAIVIKEDEKEGKPETTILSNKILEELISRKIKDLMAEGNRNVFSALKDRCDSLEKSVERWKFRAQNLQSQLNELVLEQKRFNARKPKVATRTVGINVRMVQVQSSVTTPSGPVKMLPASTPVSSKPPDKPATTRAGPVPCHLIANMASGTPVKGTSVLAPSSQPAKVTSTTSTTTTSATVKFIDLTQDEENAQKAIAASLPAGTIVRPAAVSIQPTSSLPSMPSMVSVPMMQGNMPSMMQLIPTSAGTLTPGARFPTTPQGARVTYLVPNTMGGPRQLVAIPQQNILSSNSRQPLQTILLRMNTMPQSGTTNIPQFVTTQPSNTTLSLVSTPSNIRPSVPQALVATSVSTVSTVTTTSTTPTSTAPLNTLVISCLNKHPGPLPATPVYTEDPKLKSPPPMPVLKISKVTQGIVLSWNMTINAFHAEISVYQLYAYQETAGPPTTALWKKVGDVRALPLPMACTLTQFVQGHKYHFAVRAVDVNNRLGPFSEPTSIILHTK